MFFNNIANIFDLKKKLTKLNTSALSWATSSVLPASIFMLTTSFLVSFNIILNPSSIAAGTLVGGLLDNGLGRTKHCKKNYAQNASLYIYYFGFKITSKFQQILFIKPTRLYSFLQCLCIYCSRWVTETWLL